MKIYFSTKHLRKLWEERFNLVVVPHGEIGLIWAILYLILVLIVDVVLIAFIVPRLINCIRVQFGEVDEWGNPVSSHDFKVRSAI